MLKIHLASGETRTVDLSDPTQARDVVGWLKANQANVTGIAVQEQGVQYSLPRPLAVDFREVAWEVERVAPDPEKRIKGATRVICLADETQVVLTCHQAQRAMRVDLSRPGRRVFDPRS